VKPDPHLPTARAIPKDRAERVALARGRAADGAKRAGRVAFAVTKGVSLIALCSLGLGLLGAGIGARPRSRFDTRIELQRFHLPPLPELPKLDFKLDYDELQRRSVELGRWDLRRELDRPRASRALEGFADPSASPSQRAPITW